MKTQKGNLQYFPHVLLKSFQALILYKQAIINNLRAVFEETSMANINPGNGNDCLAANTNVR